MIITKKGFYGLTAILQLAKMQMEELDSNAIFQISSIAQSNSISLSYLEQIFKKLKDAQIVHSRRGPKGGYRIAKPLNQLFVIDIMKAVNENTKFTICSDCKNSNRKTLSGADNAKICNTHIVWKDLTRIVNGYLESTDIASLVCKNNNFCSSNKTS